MSDVDRFRRLLPLLTDETTEPLRLSPEAESEMRQRLGDIDEARASALASGSSYLVWR